MDKPIIKVKNISKLYTISQRDSYDTLRDSIMNIFKKKEKVEMFWALKDISFNVKQGDIVGIIGHNGAGKTTLLKIISRITPPTTGEIRINGRVGSLLEIGTGFHPELTGQENVYLSGSILGMKKKEIKAKFDEIVKFSGIDRFLDTPVKRYSSGMFVRLAFSVAAHLDPEILLIDEVLAVGDIRFQKKCLGKMKEVTEGGRTILFVSHNMNAIESLCTSVILLEKGKIKNSSTEVANLIAEYVHDPTHQKTLSMWLNDSEGLYSNPWFKPIKFLLTDENGDLLNMPVSNTSEIWVQIEGEVSKLDAALTIGYAIFTEDNILLYWSYHTDQSDEKWPPIKVGYNILRSRIPKRFLNQSNYRIELIGSLHYRKWLFKPRENPPSVYLSIQGGLSDSSYWMVKRPGLLAPVLEWEQKK